jgi:hypothetical protein
MSQFSPAPPTAPTPVASPDSSGTGLAVAALVCGILGLCVPLLGIVAIILGVVYLARPQPSGRGLAIAGIVTGVLGLLSTVALLLALLLPALGQARQAARTVESGAQMQQIVGVMLADAEVPPADANLESRYSLPAELWISPSAEGAGRSYLRIVPEAGAAADPQAPVLVENPSVVEARSLNLVRADGTVALLSREEVAELLKAAGSRVRQSDGTPWMPED